MRRRRWRAAVLWGGCTLCVLIAATVVVSAWWMVSVQIPSGLFARFQSGTVSVGFCNYPQHLFTETDHSLGLREWNVWWRPPNRGGMRVYLVLPLYVVFLAVAIPTYLLWRFGPKPAIPGHCACGYNLTGLPEPRCPECGQPFEAKGDAP